MTFRTNNVNQRKDKSGIREGTVRAKASSSNELESFYKSSYYLRAGELRGHPCSNSAINDVTKLILFF